MIEISNVSKTFHLKSGDVEALNNVSLTINDGEKFGIIGYSGAGKSTLVRCINFLETADSGSITIKDFGRIEIKEGVLYKDGKRITNHELNTLRRSIGMIFQHFNLFDRLTVFDNIAFSLKGKLGKEEIEKRVFELLSLVDLLDKVDVYPSQLSGGQKQRVAIARALANNPKILLSDEATSALDPDATESILTLLKRLNEQLGLTIIIITHEMGVIKSVCDRVAVMENGKVVEEGKVLDIFSDPREPITKKFVASTSSLSKIDHLKKDDSPLVKTGEDEELIKLGFQECVDTPVITLLIRKFDVEVNIVLANVEAIGKDAIGGMIIRLKGTKEERDRAKAYLVESKVRVEDI